MEYTDGKWKKNSTDWDELMSTSLLDREAVIEGAVHSIRNMGDVAFIILRKREGLFILFWKIKFRTVQFIS